MGLIWSLLAVSVAAACAIIVLTLPWLGSRGPAQRFARCAIAAGIAAVGSTLMYAIHERLGGGVLTLAVGDMLMVLGPGGILMALVALTGRMRGALAVVPASVVIVVVTTALAEKPVSLLVKVLALTVLCLLVAWESSRPPIAGMPGAVMLLVVNLGYAAFSLGRIGVALTLGFDSDLYQTVFSISPTTAVGLVAVAGTGAAVLRMARSLGFGRAQRPARASGFLVGRWWVSLPESADVSAALGGTTVNRLLDDLGEVCRDVAAGGDAIRGRAAGLTGLASEQSLAELLRAELVSRGWSQAELVLISIVDARHREDPDRSASPS